MDYANDYNTPFLQQPGAMKRLGMTLGGGLILIIIVFTGFNLVFSTASEEAAIDRATQQMVIARNIAQLASSYSDDNFIRFNAASLNAVATSHYRDLLVIKAEVYGTGYNLAPLSLAEQDQALNEAERAGTQDELAADFLAQATENAINELSAVENQLPVSYQEQLQTMRADLALYLEDLNPADN